MKDDNKCPPGQQGSYIDVLKPGTRVATHSLTGRLFGHVGFIRKVAALKGGEIWYALEDDLGAYLTTISTKLWEIRPAPEPKWKKESRGPNAYVVCVSPKEDSSGARDRVLFVKPRSGFKMQAHGRCVVIVANPEKAAEKFVAFLNEIEAE